MIAMLLLVAAFAASACEISFTVEGGQKTSYKTDDEIVVNVKVSLTHRVCKVAAKDTKFKYEGIKIISATEWKEESPGVFTRQIKAKVTADGKKIMLSATRSCDKEGGVGTFSIDK